MAVIFSDDEDTPVNSGSSVQSRPASSRPFRPQDTLVENVPQWESALRGAISGLSGGLAPKAGSAVASAISGQPYPKLLHDYLERDRQAAIANPVTSTVANVVGGAPLALATGGMSTGAQIGANAALGAANSWGNTEKTGVGGAIEAGKGGAIGGTISAMFPILGKIFGGIKNAKLGSSDPEKLAEAAMKYKNAPLPPANQLGPKSGANAYEEVNKLGVPEVQPRVKYDPPRKASEVLPRRPAPEPLSDDVVKQLIQGSPEDALTKPTWDQIVATHNKGLPSYMSAVRDSALPAAIGAVTSAAPVAWASDMDPTKTLIAAGVGAASGTGLYRSGKNIPSKLRPPGEGHWSDTVSDIYNSNAVNAAKTTTTQVGARNFESVNDQPTSPFGVISNWLEHARGATNPAVEQKAQEAQAMIESGEPEEKRKAAMELQDTQDGRAVTNSEDKRRFIDDEDK